MDDEPSWAQAAAPVAPPQQQAPPSGGGGGGGNRATNFHQNMKSGSADGIARQMRIINILLSVFTGLAAVITIIAIPNPSAFFLAFYCIFFSAVLFFFECRFGFLEKRFRENFGFLYSFWGRATFLVFMASLACALGSVLGYVAGACMFINAIFNAYAIWLHPELGHGGGNHTSGEQEAAAWAARNPGQAMAIGGAAASVAGGPKTRA